jgi:hypothetical protein
MSAFQVVLMLIDLLQGDPTSSQDVFIPPLNLDSGALETDEARHLKLQRLQYKFDPTQQFWRIFSNGLLRFLVTLGFAVLLGVAIFVFSQKNVISDNGKKWFNAVSTGLSLALGMSIAHGFKAMAIDLRWWILSRQRWSLSEVSSHIIFYFCKQNELC